MNRHFAPEGLIADADLYSFVQESYKNLNYARTFCPCRLPEILIGWVCIHDSSFLALQSHISSQVNK